MDWQAFHFLRPLWLLLLIPCAVYVVYLLKHRRSTSAWDYACDAHLLPHLLVNKQKQQRLGPITMLALAWLATIMALAGPSWQQLPQPVYRAQLASVFVLDLSLSMDATDVQPSRLQRAKFKLLDMLKASEESQTALVVYAAEPYVVSPLTSDADTIAAMVPTLVTELIPAQGSQLNTALETAHDLLTQGGFPSGDIIVITDGVQNMRSVLETVNRISSEGYRVSVLAVGTRQGAPIPLRQGGFVKDRSGGIVVPQLPVDALKALSAAGKGRFAELTTENKSDLDYLLALPELQNAVIDEEQSAQRNTDTWRDEGPWLLLLVVLPLAAMAFRRGWLAGVLVCVLVTKPDPTWAFEWRNIWQTPDQQGAAAIDKGEYNRAATLFENPLWQGSAYYRDGQYNKAAEAFATVDSPDAHYNRGNALARLGRYQEAISAYDQALEQKPEHPDALFNKQLIESMLENNPSSSPQNSNETENSRSENSSTSDSPQQNSPSQGENSDSSQTSSTGDNGDESTGAQSPDSTQQPMNQQNDPAQAQPSEQQDSTQSAGHNTANELDSEQPNSNTEPGAQAGTAEDEASAPSEQPNTTPGENAPTQATQLSREDIDQLEDQQAIEQWLRRIPDDPGGLLRRKFIREHQRYNNSNEVDQPW